MFRTALAEGVENGELPAALDPEEGADTALALMEGLQLLAKVYDEPDMIAGFGRRLRDLFDDTEERT